jgi:iron(III) transport system permease protein
MARWRGIALVFLMGFVGVPLAMPFFELFTTYHPSIANQQARFLILAGNTFALIAGTVCVALPVGTAAAVLLYRTDLPGRRLLRAFTILTLFVPLSVLATAWQLALGGAGLWTGAGQRWAEGLAPAICVHAVAALPWIILIVGHGLRWVEPELEEDALLAAGPWRVLWYVTLPRSRGVIVAAAVWVALQVSGEVAVTDLMRVDTLAREVYNEFSLGANDAVARAVLMSLPLVIAASAAVFWGLTRLDRVLPPLAAALAEPRPLRLGWLRWAWFVVVLGMIGFFCGVPLASLVWKTGLSGYPGEWSWSAFETVFSKTMHAEGWLIGKSIVMAGLSAALAASIGLLLCWLALDAPGFRRAVFVLIAVTWVVPGPILGLGLKATIQALVDAGAPRVLTVPLYYGPSPLPVLWAQILHFLPCAVVGLWPVVRLLPPELRDSMRVDGATPVQELRHLVWPLVRRAWLALAVVITALALGEIGAVAMRVETPDWVTFAHELFNRMHFGQPPDVAALCLVLLVFVSALGIGTALFIELRRLRP